MMGGTTVDSGSDGPPSWRYVNDECGPAGESREHRGRQDPKYSFRSEHCSLSQSFMVKTRTMTNTPLHCKENRIDVFVLGVMSHVDVLTRC